ncbi:hypothetical protein [Mycobacterium sp.]|uniref:hypothetical protein n=1 Tax=Mycobacterium sp. TaxID=1785 RepID=UPI003F7E90C3
MPSFGVVAFEHMRRRLPVFRYPYLPSGAHRDFRDRYRALADHHGYDGRITWAAAMP